MSDAILVWIGLFIQLNAAIVVFLYLLPRIRRSITWLRIRIGNMKLFDKDSRNNSYARMGTREYISGLDVGEFFRLILYVIGFVFLIGTVVEIVTGLWYSPLTLMWWVLLFENLLLQADVMVLQAFSIAIVLVWMGYVFFHKNRPKRDGSAIKSG